MKPPSRMPDHKPYPVAERSRLALLLCGVLALPFAGAAHAQGANPVPTKIAVFDFELLDSSGGGTIAPDANDTLYLSQATDEARRLLGAAGQFALVETKDADLGAAKKTGLRDCGGCEAAIAQKLGGDQAMTGVVNRISRTEYTLLIRIVDARSGAVVSNSFTGLRMGANYSWPRGVKWLMDNRVLSAAK